jgi:hypothetical protein
MYQIVIMRIWTYTKWNMRAINVIIIIIIITVIIWAIV